MELFDRIYIYFQNILESNGEPGKKKFCIYQYIFMLNPAEYGIKHAHKYGNSQKPMKFMV